MPTKPPLVSVIMTIYNNADYLRAAIDSILEQSFGDYEFIIIDDGSKDNSSTIVSTYKDKRIRFTSRPNKGLPASLNEGIAMATGKYIARQDADDISVHDRFQKQVAWLEKHPEVGLLGTNYLEMDAQGELIKVRNVFTQPDDLKLTLVFSNQFAHGSVMLRSSLLKKVGQYNETISSAQDYDLWTRISRVSPVYNLKDTLYHWRLYDAGFSSKNPGITEDQAETVRRREFDHFCNHINEYKLLSWHPLSTQQGMKKYLEMKSTLYREMALQYAYHGYRRYAIPVSVVAIMYAPWLKKPYIFMYSFLFRKKAVRQLPYDYV